MGDILPRPAGAFPFKCAEGHCYGQPEKMGKIEIDAPLRRNPEAQASKQMPIAIPTNHPYCPVRRPKISKNMQANAQTKPRVYPPLFPPARS
jgi:hypothetical protein